MPVPGWRLRISLQPSIPSDWNDGGGFSRNPKLSLMGKPTFGETAIAVSGRERTSVVMNYRSGLSVRPVG